MPPLNSKATRALVKQRNKIAGSRSLHRGIHYEQNNQMVQTFKTKSKHDINNNSSKSDASRELLVHHQKISAELQDIYARTSALHAQNATMEERIEESWRQFERIGGKRPVNQRNNANSNSATSSSAVLCVNRTAIPFAERLKSVSESKRELRENASWERLTRGEAVDYGSTGSALHAAKDKRIALFQRRQLKRAHLLRRVGDPTPLNQSGSYDIHSGVLQIFNKTRRQVQREMAQDARVSEVYNKHNNTKLTRRSKWDVREGENVNRPSAPIVRYTREFDLEPLKQRRRNGRGSNNNNNNNSSSSKRKRARKE